MDQLDREAFGPALAAPIKCSHADVYFYTHIFSAERESGFSTFENRIINLRADKMEERE